MSRSPFPGGLTMSSPGSFRTHTFLCRGPTGHPARVVIAWSVGGTFNFGSLPTCVRGKCPTARAWGAPILLLQNEGASRRLCGLEQGVGKRSRAWLFGKQGLNVPMSRPHPTWSPGPSGVQSGHTREALG